MLVSLKKLHKKKKNQLKPTLTEHTTKPSTVFDATYPIPLNTTIGYDAQNIPTKRHIEKGMGSVEKPKIAKHLKDVLDQNWFNF